MCNYPPPPSLFAAVLAAPWLWAVAAASFFPLGLWLVALGIQRLDGREKTDLPRVSVAGLIGYSGVAIVALVLASSLAWHAALMGWDVSQIDRLESVGCSIPTLAAVDTLAGQQLSTANSLLRLGAVGALAATVFLLVRPVNALMLLFFRRARRLLQRMP
jgi:hypothetical protein